MTARGTPFLGLFAGKRVFVTGHTGFKGAWLCAWLLDMSAEVAGYSLEPPTSPNVFEACGLEERMRHQTADVRDIDTLCGAVRDFEPDIVFHMAAQALVRAGYRHPVETFTSNVIGTAHLLEAVRECNAEKGHQCAVVIVTSDKCYENTAKAEGYSECDPMGGFDPYSASKGCAELVVSAYRRSFFPPEKYSEHGVAVASARAGNVIGGGDWAEDRIVPDIMRAVVDGDAVRLRNPHAVRPWQHVLESLSGYLWLAAKMSSEGAEGYAEAWNFGPPAANPVTVEGLARRIIDAWGAGSLEYAADADAPHETHYLRLNAEKAAQRLGWRPVYDTDDAIRATVEWYKTAHEGAADMMEFTLRQIKQYTQQAAEKGTA